MKYTIEPIDFDEAVKQPWSPLSCLLSQAGKRFREPLYTCGSCKSSWFLDSEKCHNAMAVFDKYFREPGDEKKPELVALRASLPIEITCHDK